MGGLWSPVNRGKVTLYFALDLRDAISVQKDSSIPYQVRVGINLGPVKIVLDANGDKSTLGDGINCAARIMDFAGPGQIFVSRSFYEVIGCLSQEYSELFSYLGKKADKHVREFDIYEVAPARAGRVNRDVEPTPPPTQADSKKWDPEALQIRVIRLTEKFGPMARILVQRTAQRAETLEELDRILAEPEALILPENDSQSKQDSTGFDSALLDGFVTRSVKVIFCISCGGREWLRPINDMTSPMRRGLYLSHDCRDVKACGAASHTTTDDLSMRYVGF